MNDAALVELSGKHRHSTGASEISVLVALDGAFRCVGGSEAFRLGRGHTGVTFSSSALESESGSSVTLLSIRADASLFPEGLGDGTRFRSAESTRLFALARRVRERLEADDPLSALAGKGLAAELMVSALEVTRALSTRTLHRPPFWLLEVRGRIENSPSDPVSVEDMARTVGVHPDHLSRSFRRHFGVTVQQFRVSCRTVLAARLLSDTADSVAAIALEAGFCDQSHLSRCFKQAFGVPPGRYRRTRRIRRG